MCRALAYLHSTGTCHRDVKPQNLLVDPRTNVLKLCDFGSAKALIRGEPSVAYICSRYYRAPELIMGCTDYTQAIDIWSVGCVAAELMIGEPLFPGDTGVSQLVEIIKVRMLHGKGEGEEGSACRVGCPAGCCHQAASPSCPCPWGPEPEPAHACRRAVLHCHRHLAAPTTSHDLPHPAAAQVLGVPTREELVAMNPGFTEFSFPGMQTTTLLKVSTQRAGGRAGGRGSLMRAPQRRRLHPRTSTPCSASASGRPLSPMRASTC